jgi:hypothetical protein
MGQEIKQLKFETFDMRHFEAFQEIAYKAIFERGFVDVEFNKQHWNIHLKNLVTLNSNIVRLIWVDNELIGFYIIQLHNLPWNHRTHAIFTLMHIVPKHRNVSAYEIMFKDAEYLMHENKVSVIQTTNESIMLPENEKLTLLHNNGFNHTEQVWESKRNV